MINLRPSAFNKYAQRDSRWYVVNYHSQAVLELSPETYSLLREGQCRDIADGERDLLFEHGILVPSTVEEHEQILELNRKMRSQPTIAGLCLVPTMACNLACDYCYQNVGQYNRETTISCDELQLGLICYLRGLLERYSTITSLQVNWYGGEPLLRMDKVRLLSEWLLGQATDLGISLELSMITNGYLLGGEVASQLAGLNWRWLQITLDGARSVHDQRRRHRSGVGTFDTIVANILGLAAYPEIRVAVRVNVDRTNVETISDMLAQLHAAGVSDLSNVGLYFAPVRAAGKKCLTDLGCFMDTVEFGAVESEFLDQALALGFQASVEPRSRIAGCSATSPAVIVVGPQGQVHKCVGSLMYDELAVGSLIRTGLCITDQTLNDAWNNWSPGGDCRECSVLPMCMGGCAMEDVLMAAGSDSQIALVSGEDRCSGWLHSAEKLAGRYVDTLLDSEEGEHVK